MTKRHQSRWGRKHFLSSAAMALAIEITGLPATAYAQESVRVDMEAQPLGEALGDIGNSFGVTVIAPDALVRGKRASRISGSLTAEQAVARVLRGSGLTYRRTRTGGFVVEQQTARVEPVRQPRPVRVEAPVEPEEPMVEETIVVTGSRLARTNATAPSPVQILSAEDIRANGQTDLSDVLRLIPSLNSSLTSSQSAIDVGGEAIGDELGAAQLDLRGLGTERTLVLVNGRRHVAGLAGEATVDVATIPAALIDRVEVLTGGGSSIYGADAVSGVVNFVLKKDFEGIDYRGDFTISDNGDAESYFGAVTLGGNFAEGRGNAVVSAEYTRQTEIGTSDRDFAGTGFEFLSLNSGDFPAFLGVDPAFSNVLIPNPTVPVQPMFSAIALNGNAFDALLDFADGITEFEGFPILQVVDETGTLRPIDFGVFGNPFDSIGGDGIQANDATQSLIPEIDRFVVNANARYEISSAAIPFIEAKYAFTETNAGQPSNTFDDDIPIALDNAFLPDALLSQIATLEAAGITPELTLLRTAVGGAEAFRSVTERETFRILGGVEGEIATGLSYTISANYGRTEISEINTGARLEDRFFAAVDAVVDPATGETVCRSDIDPTAIPPVSSFPTTREGFLTFSPGDGSCVPTSLFGLNPITPEAADFIFIETEDTSELEQIVVQAVLTGNTSDYFELPGGGVGFAAGVEYRREDSESLINEPALLGLTFSSVDDALQPTFGDFDVIEGFAEVSVPILAGVPFAEELTIDGAVRVSEYSTVGTTVSYSGGGVWRPLTDLRLRGSYNRAVRAPNIAELFSPEQVVVINSTFDPCNPAQLGDGSEFRVANCLELVGPDFDSLDFVSSAITGRAGGNPDLTEETADTITVGFVYTPSFIPGLTVIADYYDIEIEDAIGVTDGETILENCVDAPSLDNSFCPLITRDPNNGIVTFFQSGTVNIAALEASGIDFQVNYQFRPGDLVAAIPGDVNMALSGTYLIERNDFPFQDFPDEIDTLDGEFTFPDLLLNFALGWTHGPWSADYSFNYQTSQNLPFIENEELAANPFFANVTETGDAFVHTIGGSYEVIPERLEISLRINNLTDREPFVTTLTRPAGPIGRTFNLGIRGSF